MSETDPHLFQGRDWTTARWKVAEAFDSADRLSDLCLCDVWEEELDSEEESRFAFLNGLFALIEMLETQCAVAMADTIPVDSVAPAFAQAWCGIELRRTLHAMRTEIIALSRSETLEPLSEIAFLAKEVKARLKKLDG